MRKRTTTEPLISHDPGVDQVETWLEDWLGPHALISLKPFELDTKLLAVWKPRYRNTNKYKAAFTQNQSLFHSHLKFLGRLWLEDEPIPKYIGSADINYEVRMYFPDPKLAHETVMYDSRFDVSRPQVLLPKGRRDVTAIFGRISCADVYGRRTVIEIGRTSPYNLCMPCLSRLAERSVWIPFPDIPFTAETDPDRIELDLLKAYEIKVELDEDYASTSRSR